MASYQLFGNSIFAYLELLNASLNKKRGGMEMNENVNYEGVIDIIYKFKYVCLGLKKLGSRFQFLVHILRLLLLLLLLLALPALLSFLSFIVCCCFFFFSFFLLFSFFVS